MANRRITPVEVAGYRSVRAWTYDSTLESADFRWWSVRNDEYDDDDFLPWYGDSSVDDCPF